MSNIFYIAAAIAIGGGGATCYLSYGESVLKESSSGSVRIEKRTYAEEVEGLTEDQCSAEEAEERGAAMPCIDFHVLQGTLVE